MSRRFSGNSTLVHINHSPNDICIEIDKPNLVYSEVIFRSLAISAASVSGSIVQFTLKYVME